MEFAGIFDGVFLSSASVHHEKLAFADEDMEGCIMNDEKGWLSWSFGLGGNENECIVAFAPC